MTKKPAIAFLLWNTKKSGGNKFVFNIANRLVERRYKVTIFSLFSGPVDWFLLKMKIQSWLSFRWLRERPDILIATFWPTAYIALFLPASKKMYLVQNWEAGFYQNPVLSFLVRQTLKLPYQVITISQFLREKIRQFHQGPIAVIPVACDLHLFKAKVVKHTGSGRRGQDTLEVTAKVKRGLDVRRPEWDPWRWRGKEADESKRILSVVSTYDPFKGIKELIWLVKKLKAKHPSWRFVLVSFEPHPPAAIFNEFISTPPTKKLVEEYCQADLFLLTSKLEGFPLPPLEAMACATPVVVTDSGGVREYARNNFNCLMGRDAGEIFKAEMVEQVLSDQTLRSRLISNGLKTAKKFTWEKTMEKLEKFLSTGGN